MVGTRAGGLKARDTNLRKRSDFYSYIGHLGGVVSKGGGFASTKIGEDGLTGRERAKIAGAKGGRKSRRGKDKTLDERVDERVREILNDFKG